MTSESRRDPVADHLLTPENASFVIIDYQPVQVGSIRSMDQGELVFNIISTVKAALNYGLPVIHSTVNVSSGRNKPTVDPVRELLGRHPVYDRTTINSWEDIEFRGAVEQAGRRKLVMTALWTEACLTFPALDAMRDGFEVYAVADAVGGTSVAAHEAALRRIEQAGAHLISRAQLYCELQRDWNRTGTIPGFMEVFKHFEGPGSRAG